MNKKKILFASITIFTVIFVIEIFSLATYLLLYKTSPYSHDTKNSKHPEITKNFSIGGAIARRVLHPYLGYVHLPTDKPKNLDSKKLFENCQFNQYGFLGKNNLLKKSKNTVNILITGGSVANQFYCFAREDLANILRKKPIFQNKKFNFIGLAVGAWKQPQQLLALNYYLSQGGEFDILINIDGYNEVANYNTVLNSQNMHYTYPLHWKKLINNHSSKEDSIINKILFYKNKSRVISNLSNRFSFSAFMGLITRLLNQNMENSIIKLNLKLQNTNFDLQRNFYRNGPNIKIKSFIDQSADLWFRSSRLMGQIAYANNAQYFHLLQPSQYNKNSKPFSKKEINSYISKGKSLIPEFYNSFRVKSKSFNKNEVSFSDLSFLFAKERQTLYVDACCHFNKKGNKIMAKTIAKLIIKNKKYGYN